MYIIKLSAIDSTNGYLKALAATKMPKDFTVVVAEDQTGGRGQMGTVWQSEASKNLTFSVFKDVSHLGVDQQFYVSMATALAITSALRELRIPKLSIKWPNDILAEHKKVGGILIENIIKNNKLQGTIIGVGINVNQRYFDNLPQASSLYSLTGVVHSVDEVLQRILKQLETNLNHLESRHFEILQQNYEASLFRRHKPSTFQMPNGQTFSGFINGVTKDGKLQILLEDNVNKAFDLKEVKLLY